MTLAARIGDLHTCPGTGPGLHVGGPITQGDPTVLIDGMPAARVGDMAQCVGGPPDVIAQGSPTVFIGGMMAARMGDMTAHGGVITQGCPSVMIGMSNQEMALALASKTGAPFCEKCAK